MSAHQEPAITEGHASEPPRPAFEVVPCPICGDASNVRVVRDAGPRGRVVRCRRCDLGFVSPRPVSTIDLYTDPSYFDAAGEAPGTDEPTGAGGAGYLAYREDAEVMGTYFARVARSIAKATGGGGRLLEVGCANGSFLRQAREAGFAVQGVEPGAAAAAEGRAAGLPIITGTLDDAALEPGAWDVVVLLQTVEHLPQPQDALGRLFELLRPGGTLVLTTPNQRSWLARISGSRWFEYKPPEHLYLFTPRTIGALLARAGFEAIRVTPDVHRYPPRWVLRRLGRYVPAARPLVALAERLLPGALLDCTLPVYYGSMRVVARRPPGA